MKRDDLKLGFSNAITYPGLEQLSERLLNSRYEITAEIIKTEKTDIKLAIKIIVDLGKLAINSLATNSPVVLSAMSVLRDIAEMDNCLSSEALKQLFIIREANCELAKNDD